MYMYVYIYIYIHVCVYIYIYTHIVSRISMICCMIRHLFEQHLRRTSSVRQVVPPEGLGLRRARGRARGA